MHNRVTQRAGNMGKPCKKTRRCAKYTSAYSLCIFMVGLVIIPIFNHFAIQRQIKGFLEANDGQLAADGYRFLPIQALAGLKAKDFDVRKRVKRQASSSADFAAAHLLGDSGRNVRNSGTQQIPQFGNFFRWTSRSANSFSLLELDESDNRGTFVVINKSGFYLIYSQVLYNGHGLFRVGHETVRISPRDERHSLMTTWATQQLSTSRNDANVRRRSVDSGFHAGIFYLNSGDRIGVKPMGYRKNHSMSSRASYFGLYFLWDWNMD